MLKVDAQEITLAKYSIFFSESLRPRRRKSFKAYDGLNNLLNLAYEMLKWKVHIAMVKAKLEPMHACMKMAL